MKKAGIAELAVKRISSVDIKEKEKGLHEYGETLHCDTEFFTSEELESVPGEFTESEFVKSITGVGNVCERSAVFAAGKGSLIAGKIAWNGVTVALAQKDWRVRFE